MFKIKFATKQDLTQLPSTRLKTRLLDRQEGQAQRELQPSTRERGRCHHQILPGCSGATAPRERGEHSVLVSFLVL